MARLLFLDTATANCHVGLGDENGIVVSKVASEAFKHAEVLTKLIDACMQEANWEYAGLDAVVITGGPGSYTGLRIGASVAKGICFAVQAKLIALNTLEVMAKGFTLAEPTYQGCIVPMIDARRMEVFTAVYLHSGDSIRRPAPLILDQYAFDDLPNLDVAFIGDGAEKFKALYGKSARFENAFFLGPDAMFALAQDAFALGKFESIAYYRPDYHKDFYSAIAK